MTRLVSKVTELPSAEPVSLSECYKHLRLDGVDVDSDGVESHVDDSLLSSLISAARESVESFTGRSIAVKGYAVAFSEFPDEIELPHPPLVRVESIVYDGAESDSILAESSYVVDEFSVLPTITPSSTWPTIATGNKGYVYYRAGYAVPGDESEPEPLPAWARTAILLLVAHWYRNREAADLQQLKEIPLGIEFILRPHRVELSMG